MPFHGLASQIVIGALKEGQQGNLFAANVAGSVEVNKLAAGHRRWDCPGPEGAFGHFWNSAGEPGKAHIDALHFQESLTGNVAAAGTTLRLRDLAAAAEVPSHTTARHPVWHFEGFQIWRYQVVICSLVLIFAGILCAAGGIGGGGIYVTLLMVAGSVSVVDAVPLSKAVVFLGSVPSLVLNIRKSISSSKTLIDYNICRLVVPSSLMGTFVGVFLNRILPSWVLLLVLSMILIVMTTMVARTTLEQYMEEERKETEKLQEAEKEEDDPEPQPEPLEVARQPNTAGGDDAKAQDTSALVQGGYQRNRRRTLQLPGVGAGGAGGAGSVNASQAEISDTSTEEAMRRSRREGSRRATSALAVVGAKVTDAAMESKQRSMLTTKDVLVSVSTLLIVVLFSVFRYHAGLCKSTVSLQGADEVCHHPALVFLGYNTLQAWMHHQGSADFLMVFSVVFPCTLCCCVALYYSVSLVRFEGWSCANVLGYDVMAIVTGCLAGLVGIGGGLVFSPFFLLMGLDPSIAVATSSTCVIFTSSSTTLQYLLTDRVVVSLAVVYGMVNIIASYAGTKFVHFLMDDFNARKSYISAIVGLGVLISAVLSLIKLASVASGVATAAH